jgi:hypothetical protein
VWPSLAPRAALWQARLFPQITNSPRRPAALLLTGVPRR